MIVKIGSAVVVNDEGDVALDVLSALVTSLARAQRSGCEVALVTSGAVAVGARRLAVSRASRSGCSLRGCAAVGQAHLMGLYAELFARCGLDIGQILLTTMDVASPGRVRQAMNVLSSLTGRGVVPIINENDVVVLRGAPRMRDNDHLAALLARGWAADALLLLSSVDGVLIGGRRAAVNRKATVVPHVHPRQGTVPGVWRTAGPGRGGMHSKLAAARHAALGGTTVVIANGRTPRIVDRVLGGERVGTWLTMEHSTDEGGADTGHTPSQENG
ncbi:MAG: glutamate 5-kinase [Gemmatimonadaceae bacterium]